MATQIVMPQLGESVAEGIIGKWLKAEGDPIGKDEPIVEVITDKVNAEIPSPVAGVLEKISAAEGATVAVGQEIAVIGDGSGQESSRTDESREPAGVGGSPSQSPAATQAGPAPQSSQFSPSGSTGYQANDQDSYQASGSGVAVGTHVEQDEPNGSRVVRSSPLVQRLAAEHNIDMSQIHGTGIGGRVSKKDILQVINEPREQQPAAPPAQPAATMAPPQPVETPPAPTVTPPSPAPAPAAAAPTPSPVPTSETRTPGPRDEIIPISPVRRMIAEHMTRSKFTLPHATTMIEIDMTPVVRYRQARKDQWQQREGIPLSYMAFVAKATVEALKEFPLVNSEWGGDKIILKKDVNLGLAVAAPDGLIVPNIKNADRLSIAGLAHAVIDLTERARNRKLSPDDVAGGTFTLNNTGAIGSVWSVSIINYPQAGILSADAIVKRAWVMPDDSIAVRHIMNLCMSFDHRTLDGATISSFMQFIRRRLESWPEDASLY